MQNSKTLETWVGLFVALGIAGMFFLAMKVSNLGDLQSKDNSFKITARFSNAGSLKERAPVSMAGVRVGRVSSIHFDKTTYEAVVEMRIDPEFDTLPTDTTASVLTAGLLGEQYVGLSAGGADEFLKNGDEIELTQSALVLEEVISRFLFNKAEGSSEKKDAPASAANTPVSGDVAPDNSVTEEMPAEPARPLEPEAVPAAEEAKPQPAKAEEPAAHAHKPKEEAEETSHHAHKPKHEAAAEEPAASHHSKAAHGKSQGETATGHKAKDAHGKTGEAAESAHKTGKSAVKGAATAP